jgi:hypothetical protein
MQERWANRPLLNRVLPVLNVSTSLPIHPTALLQKIGIGRAYKKSTAPYPFPYGPEH